MEEVLNLHTLCWNGSFCPDINRANIKVIQTSDGGSTIDMAPGVSQDLELSYLRCYLTDLHEILTQHSCLVDLLV